jgi:glycosyltransferase involved in cell wall biosynthesis
VTGPVEPALLEAGVEVTCLNQPDMQNNPSKLGAMLDGLWNFRAAAALAEFLAALPDDAIVHLHGYAKSLSASLKQAIEARGLPCVFTLHDYFLMCPTGGFYNYRSEEICTLKPMSGACLLTNCDMRSHGRKLWRVARQAIAESGAPLSGVFSDLILVTPFQRKAVGRYLPAGARQHILSNPVNVADHGPKTQTPRGGFLFVGRLSPEKGPLVFAKAAEMAGVEPTFVGDGPLKDEIAQRFPKAQLLGWRSPAEVHALMREARALVFPSVWYEGQGLVVLEAKALGAPIIVSDACAARDEVEHGRSGLLFKSGDPASLALALQRLRDNDLAFAMSQAAYDDYWANPRELRSHVAGLESIYGPMAASRSLAQGA